MSHLSIKKHIYTKYHVMTCLIMSIQTFYTLTRNKTDPLPEPPILAFCSLTFPVTSRWPERTNDALPLQLWPAGLSPSPLRLIRPGWADVTTCPRPLWHTPGQNRLKKTAGKQPGDISYMFSFSYISRDGPPQPLDSQINFIFFMKQPHVIYVCRLNGSVFLLHSGVPPR